MTDEMNRQVEAYLPLVDSIARRMFRELGGHVEMDELVQNGRLGLMSAARLYDSTRNENFSKYAKIRIRGAILDGVRSDDPVSRSIRAKQKQGELVGFGFTVSMDAPLGDSEAPLSETLRADDEPSGVDPFRWRLVLESLPLIRPRLARLLRLRYSSGLTMKQVGRILGVNESRVYQLHEKAISALRDVFSGNPALGYT